ncbi:hypothetical protein J2S09_000847 [Bacillus fengqiuensis]|nr:hypothetical protein [Bacillus fengqiuensis]
MITLSNVKHGNWTASISYTHEEVVERLLVFYGEKNPNQLRFRIKIQTMKAWVTKYL